MDLSGNLFYFILAAFVIVAIVLVWNIARLAGMWSRARSAGAPVGVDAMLGMWLRKVPFSLIVEARIMAVQEGMDIPIGRLEEHYLAGGNVMQCVRAFIYATRVGLPLDFDQVCALDLASKGTSKTVLDAVFEREDRMN